MAFKSKRNSQKATVEGLSKVFKHYDETVFYQKTFEGLLADHVPYAYAMKSRLILMGKSGDLAYFCTAGKQLVRQMEKHLTQKTERQENSEKSSFDNDLIQQVRKKADTFAAYYGFEKQTIYHDINLIFNALGLADPVLTIHQSALPHKTIDLEESPLNREVLKGKPYQKKKKMTKAALPVQRKTLPIIALIMLCIAIGVGYGYMLYQFSDLSVLKTLIKTYSQPFSFENMWLVYGGGIIGVGLIAQIVSLRSNGRITTYMPWLMLSLECATVYFKIRDPLQFEWLALYVLALYALYSIMTTLVLISNKRTTRKMMSKHLVTLYGTGMIFLASQYIIRMMV